MLLKELRQIIREVLADNMAQKIQDVMNDAIDTAKVYVHAVENKKMFGMGKLIKNMKEDVKQVVSLAKWLAMRHEPIAIKVNDVVISLERIIEMSSFADQTWNKRENVEDLVAHLSFAQKTAENVMYEKMSSTLNQRELSKIGSVKTV